MKQTDEHDFAARLLTSADCTGEPAQTPVWAIWARGRHASVVDLHGF
jgi:hypothetical protein